MATSGQSGGEVWTDASYWNVDRDLAEDYNVHLARKANEVGSVAD